MKVLKTKTIIVVFLYGIHICKFLKGADIEL